MLKWLILLASLLTVYSCSKPPESLPPVDETKQEWYGEAVSQAKKMAVEAEAAFRAGKSEEASDLIQEGEKVTARLLKVPHPPVEAVEAASDLDDLYGRMLLSNRHYGWARMVFQRNLARWKNWQPQSEEVIRRRKQAEAGIIECDKNIR